MQIACQAVVPPSAGRYNGSGNEGVLVGLMRLELKIAQKQIQKLKPTLQQLQYYRLLQLTNLELEEDIREELSQNPALEVEEVRRCPKCGEILLEGQPCVTCLSGKVEDSDRREELGSEKLDMMVEIYSSSAGNYEASTYEAVPEDELPDAFASVVRTITLEDYLKRRLAIDCSDMSEEDRLLAEDIIDRIDAGPDVEEDEREDVEHGGKEAKVDNPGLIRATDEELARELGAPVERVARMRRRVAEIDPIGCGLSSAIEVLALQAELAEDLPPEERTALAELIRKHLDDISKERYSRVGKKVGLSADRVKQLVDYMRRRFHLHPRRKFEEEESNAAVENPYVSADVEIREVDGKLVVEVLDSGLPQLRMNKFYIESYRRLRSNREAFSADERKHIREYFERASAYLENLNSRRQTMLEITEEIIKRQEAFLRYGPLYLRKLTRKQVAEAIGVHPSTVSRALAVRYCRLPNNSIVPFSVFFNPSLCYIEMINQILEKETRDRVFSDEEIRDIMAERGHDLSRRVITKYRKKGRIPPSGRRKRLLISKWKKEQAEKAEQAAEEEESYEDATLSEAEVEEDTEEDRKGDGKVEPYALDDQAEEPRLEGIELDVTVDEFSETED